MITFEQREMRNQISILIMFAQHFLYTTLYRKHDINLFMCETNMNIIFWINKLYLLPFARRGLFFRIKLYLEVSFPNTEVERERNNLFF